MDRKFLEQAIDLAYQNVRNQKGEPYGAVVVKDGKVIGTGTNDVQKTNDPTAHAEIQAVREACEYLQSTDLSDCDIYASSEPCPMCLATIYWTGANAIYYSYPKEPSEDVFGSAYVYKQIALPMEERAIRMERVENPQPDKNPIALWQQEKEGK